MLFLVRRPGKKCASLRIVVSCRLVLNNWTLKLCVKVMRISHVHDVLVLVLVGECDSL